MRYLHLEMEKTLMLMQLTEKEVEDCLVNGMSAQEVSKKLGISIATIEDHRKNIKKDVMEKVPGKLLSCWQEDIEGFFDFAWVYHCTS
jgi:FixJ family two-component response regulator